MCLDMSKHAWVKGLTGGGGKQQQPKQPAGEAATHNQLNQNLLPLITFELGNQTHSVAAATGSSFSA